MDFSTVLILFRLTSHFLPVDWCCFCFWSCPWQMSLQLLSPRGLPKMFSISDSINSKSIPEFKSSHVAPVLETVSELTDVFVELADSTFYSSWPIALLPQNRLLSGWPPAKFKVFPPGWPPAGSVSPICYYLAGVWLLWFTALCLCCFLPGTPESWFSTSATARTN